MLAAVVCKPASASGFYDCSLLTIRISYSIGSYNFKWCDDFGLAHSRFAVCMHKVTVSSANTAPSVIVPLEGVVRAMTVRCDNRHR